MQIKWERLDGRGGHEAGRELLRQLCRERTGEDCPPVLIAPRGKPYFENENLHFSISHTKKHVFCVLSSHPVGIDAEEKDRKVNLRLAEKILSLAEYARYERAPDKPEALLRLWVLKEAAAKLTGEGLQGFPNQTDFSPDDPRMQEIDGCFVAVLKENDHAV